MANSSGTLPRLYNQGNRFNVGFAGNLLKQDRIAYFHGAIVNILIVYKLQKRTNVNPDLTLENCLLGSVQTRKNVDTSKCNYSGYGIGFDLGSSFSFGDSLNAKKSLFLVVTCLFQVI